MVKQAQTIEAVKKLAASKFPNDDIRVIKIHGGQYQEAGLPDFMLLVGKKYKFWLEAKSSWKDEPSQIQKHNIKNLRDHGFITGYVVGKEFKIDWDSTVYSFDEFIGILEVWNNAKETNHF